ncbi:GFA family protein [Dongia deserti]|uniref:GFA family protein n=1 Tax=Dongia deserti TaxID=2268030 RepID=UPI000E64C9F5|nr:GFA family protein [Dongia deserti]
MTTRQASCSCGQLRVTCEGEPVRLSMCHCLECQKRTGSPFGVQARFRREQVTKIEGEATEFARVGDEGNRVTFRFCPACGSTVYWTLSGFPELIAVAVGAFADVSFPAPRFSVYERRRHPWVIVPDHPDMQRID